MTRKFLLAASLLMAVTAIHAQNAATPPPAPPNAAAPIVRTPRAPRPPRPESDMREHREGRGGDMHDHEGMDRIHGSMDGDLLPPGTWWRSPEIATRIGLSADQQKRIDELFLQSRVQLIHLHASLEEAQLLLEPLLNASPVDQPKALAQIGKIADTRAELEKTNAKMLLSIRAVLNADEWTKLQEGHRGFHGGAGGPMGHGPGGAQ